MRLHTPPNAKLIPKEEKCIFKGIIYDVYQWEQEVFDGSKKTFEMLKSADTVRVIAIKDGKIVIARQEILNTVVFICIPSGMNDRGTENELECAKKELLEETGIK